jgi:predicted phage terminase large subunit-like protein
MPPRHGKSEFISKYFIAWHLFRYPEKRIILTSYSNQFAEIWGRKAKEIIDEHGKAKFGFGIKPTARSFKSFEMDGYEGGLHVAGAGSSITGRGADLLIIDDPIKNNIEANSHSRREMLFDWFQSTAYSRLEPGGISILVMTRWHRSDLTGKIAETYNLINYPQFQLEKQSLSEESWVLLSLPAIACDGDMTGRTPGEPLWPERYNYDKLTNLKLTLHPRWFNALYQQNPLNDENSLFKKSYFKYFHEDELYYYLGGKAEPEEVVLKHDCCVRATIDLASTASKNSDYSVILVFAVTPDKRILVLDIYRERLLGSEQIKLIDAMILRWKPQIIGIETVQYQTAFADQMRARGLNIKDLKPDHKGKTHRAEAIQNRVFCGSVYFKANSHWLSDFEAELTDFPNCTHDDQVDAFAYIENMLFSSSNYSVAGSKGRRNVTSDYRL